MQPRSRPRPAAESRPAPLARPSPPHRAGRDYAVAVAAVAIAALATLLVPPIATAVSFALFLTAVVGSARWGGTRSGFAATAMSALVLAYLMVPERFSLTITRSDALALTVFGAAGVIATLLARRQAPDHAAAPADTPLVIAAGLDAVVVVDRHGPIRTANPQAETLFGFRLAELQGRSLSRLVAERFADTVSAAVARCDGEAEWRAAGVDVAGRRRDGSEFPAEMRLRRIVSADGTFVGCTVRDITARRHAEERQAERLAEVERTMRAEADTAGRLRDEFLATVSHELRTPLTSMLGWARLLRTRALEPAMTARALDSIERNAKLQAQLIDDLLDVSRIITGRLRLDVRPVDLAGVITAAVETVRAAGDAKGIVITATLAPEATRIAGDPDRLLQIVWNLLSNAIKFTPAGGRVDIDLSLAGDDRARISVRDTGKGISPQFLPFVFTRFRQAETLSGRSGLGLGLAIVRHLVELHGGTAAVASAGEGQGTTFTIEFPRLTAPGGEAVRPTAVTPRTPDEPLPSLAGLHVLLVDDEQDARDLVATVLRECGAEVTTAASAPEALDELDRVTPSVLISDIAMPGEDGYALIRQVRARPLERGGQVPAVALTAYARLDDRWRALSAGYQRHVPKPIEPADLATVVARLAAGRDV
jgi:PAS domain S-box-containing protein